MMFLKNMLTLILKNDCFVIKNDNVIFTARRKINQYRFQSYCTPVAIYGF